MCQLEIPPEILAKFQTLKEGTYASINIDINDPFASVAPIFDHY